MSWTGATAVASDPVEVGIVIGDTMSPPPTGRKLSARQIEILKLLCDGLETKEIAVKLNLSPRTVEFHRENLCKVIGTKRLALLVRWAIRHGVIQP